MVRRLAVFVTVLLSFSAAAYAQSESQLPLAVFNDGALARIRDDLVAAPAPALDARFVAAARHAAARLQQPTVAEWQREFEHTTALRRKSNNVMRLGLVLAGVGALSAMATPSAKVPMAVAGAVPGLGIATWGYLARRKGDRELKRLQSTRPAGARTPGGSGKTK